MTQLVAIAVLISGLAILALFFAGWLCLTMWAGHRLAERCKRLERLADTHAELRAVLRSILADVIKAPRDLVERPPENLFKGLTFDPFDRPDPADLPAGAEYWPVFGDNGDRAREVLDRATEAAYGVFPDDGGNER